MEKKGLEDEAEKFDAGAKRGHIFGIQQIDLKVRGSLDSEEVFLG